MMPLDLVSGKESPISDQDTLSVDLKARKVGEIVAADYRRARVMKQYGIEFCCGGGIPLEEACRRKQVDVDEVLTAIEGLERDPGGLTTQAAGWSNDLLIHYIEETHHGYVRQSLGALKQFTSKVARVHGDAVPALREIAETFDTVAAEMQEHMEYEENVLFPAIKTDPASASTLIERAEDEHVVVGEAMQKIRELSDDFTPPDWACATYRAAFTLLKEFEEDLHAHVHLENNVLFARLDASVN